MWKEVATVVTLKRAIWPWSTLMSVAKPSICVESTSPRSHSLGGLPGFEFSQTISLTAGGLQTNVGSGPAASAGAGAGRGVNVKVDRTIAVTARSEPKARIRRAARVGR